MSEMALMSAGQVKRGVPVVVRCQTADEFVRITCESGLLVSVAFAATWHQVTPQALRDRMRRGTLTKFVVCGQVMISLKESKPLVNWVSSRKF